MWFIYTLADVDLFMTLGNFKLAFNIIAACYYHFYESQLDRIVILVAICGIDCRKFFLINCWKLGKVGTRLQE